MHAFIRLKIAPSFLSSYQMTLYSFCLSLVWKLHVDALSSDGLGIFPGGIHPNIFCWDVRPEPNRENCAEKICAFFISYNSDLSQKSIPHFRILILISAIPEMASIFDMPFLTRKNSFWEQKYSMPSQSDKHSLFQTKMAKMYTTPDTADQKCHWKTTPSQVTGTFITYKRD